MPTVPLRQLSPKLPCGESHGHKSGKSRTQTVTNHEIIKFLWK